MTLNSFVLIQLKISNICCLSDELFETFPTKYNYAGYFIVSIYCIAHGKSIIETFLWEVHTFPGEIMKMMTLYYLGNGNDIEKFFLVKIP